MQLRISCSLKSWDRDRSVDLAYPLRALLGRNRVGSKDRPARVGYREAHVVGDWHVRYPPMRVVGASHITVETHATMLSVYKISGLRFSAKRLDKGVRIDAGSFRVYAGPKEEERYQFKRQGPFYCSDDGTLDMLVKEK